MTDNYPTSVNLSKGAKKYLDHVSKEFQRKHGVKPNRSELVELIITQKVDLTEYPMPEDIRKEILGE